MYNSQLKCSSTRWVKNICAAAAAEYIVRSAQVVLRDLYTRWDDGKMLVRRADASGLWMGKGARTKKVVLRV